MTETERYQIKSALLKCAKENENRPTFTGHIVVSSLCKSAVERIEELEKENAELKEQLGDKVMQKRKDKADLVWKLKTANEQKKSQLAEVKDLLKDIISTPRYNQMDGEAYENEEYKELIAEAEHFISEVENE